MSLRNLSWHLLNIVIALRKKLISKACGWFSHNREVCLDGSYDIRRISQSCSAFDSPLALNEEASNSRISFKKVQGNKNHLYVSSIIDELGFLM